MTTPTLTHEQAAILRAIDVDVFCQYLGNPIVGSDDLSWAIVDGGVLELSPAGQAALAKYDKEIADALLVLDELTEHLVVQYGTTQKNAIAILRERLSVKC